MTRTVEVRTGARLHFGLLSTGHPGRLGGIGMMIDRPGYVLRASVADKDVIIAGDETRRRIEVFLIRIREGLETHVGRARASGGGERLSGRLRGRYLIEIAEAIPSHAGFGSGTQLAFAVGAAVAQLIGFKPYFPEEWLGRGERSRVGLVGFYRGGFIADPGEVVTDWPNDGSPHSKLKIPSAWRIVVVQPPSHGPSGEPETEAFRQLGPMPAETTDRLAHLVTDQVLPAITPGLFGGSAAKRFTRFASAVAEFNRLVGEHFAPVQGAVYAHPLIRDLARTLADTDWPHLAQSSWGPAAAVFCESQESAEALQTFLARHLTPDAAHVFIATPRNTGADVTFTEP